jgi:hypothetical protein
VTFDATTLSSADYVCKQLQSMKTWLLCTIRYTSHDVPGVSSLNHCHFQLKRVVFVKNSEVGIWFVHSLACLNLQC